MTDADMAMNPIHNNSGAIQQTFRFESGLIRKSVGYSNPGSISRG